MRKTNKICSFDVRNGYFDNDYGKKLFLENQIYVLYFVISTNYICQIQSAAHYFNQEPHCLPFSNNGEIYYNNENNP